MSTKGDNWTRNDNWLTDAPLEEWHGVMIDDTGRVAKLVLRHNGLRGELPSRLANLTELDLWYNELSGEIPPELAGLSSLKKLDLGFNKLIGQIPAELGSLMLNQIGIDRNPLSGCIPSGLRNVPVMHSGLPDLPYC